MDQVRIGEFLKELRKEKGVTQEELAEMLGVNNRSVSRWENARTMPDFDILIELAKYYDLTIDELLSGQREEKDMDRKEEKTLYDIAEYTNHEKERMARNQQLFAWCGVICWIIFIGITAMNPEEGSVLDAIASFSAGGAFGMAIMMLLITSGYISRIQAFKRRHLNR